MTGNELVISKFYAAFQQLDYTGMNSCYADDIIFNDPVFGIIEGEVAMSMWEMLCTNAKDFTLSYGNIKLLDEEYATCEWQASYTFSKTGRKVVNQVKAFMRLRDGKIIEHSDKFDLYKWSRQALGFSGWLLGWTKFMKNRIRRNAGQSLIRFIEKKQHDQ